MGVLFSQQDEENKAKLTIQAKNQRYQSPQQVQQALTTISNDLNQVVEIVLSGNSYSPQACQSISEALRSCPNISIVDFSDIFVGRVRHQMISGMEHLIGVLDPAKIIVLDVSHNAFGPDGVRTFQDLLTQAVSLKDLKVDNNGLGPEGCIMIAQGLKRCQDMKLQVFCGSRSRLENQGILALADVFGSMGSLRKVSVFQNGIEPEGLQALFRALQQNPDIQMIDVNDNKLNEEFAWEALAECVQNHQYLSVLNVSDCLLGDQGTLRLLQSLKKSNRYLVELYLNYNDLTQGEICEKISELFESHQTLEKVEIKGNQISRGPKQALKINLERIERDVLVVFLSEGEEEMDDDFDPEEEVEI